MNLRGKLTLTSDFGLHNREGQTSLVCKLPHLRCPAPAAPTD